MKRFVIILYVLALCLCLLEGVWFALGSLVEYPRVVPIVYAIHSVILVSAFYLRRRHQ